MDVIALHAAGFENAVATLGTALTQEQARLLAKHTKQVLICYDSDDAGQAATRKAFRILSEVGLDVRILKMEGAKDPDEYIKKFGADSFRRVLDSALTGFDYKLANTLKKYNVSIPAEKVKASRELCEYIAEIPSNVEREVYIASVASTLALSPEGIKNDVESIRKKRIKEFNARTSQEARLTAMGVGDRINVDGIKNVKAKAAEEAIIGLMLLFDEYRDAVAVGKVELSGADFFSEFHKRVFEKMVELQKENQYDFSMLGQFFTPDEIGRLQGLEQKRRALTENGKSVFLQCVEALKHEKSLSSTGDEGGIDEIRRLLDSKRKK